MGRTRTSGRKPIPTEKVYSYTQIWTCQCGHWGRLEIKDVDKCPVCGKEVTKKRKKLPQLMEKFPFDMLTQYCIRGDMF